MEEGRRFCANHRAITDCSPLGIRAEKNWRDCESLKRDGKSAGGSMPRISFNPGLSAENVCCANRASVGAGQDR